MAVKTTKISDNKYSSYWFDADEYDYYGSRYSGYGALDRFVGTDSDDDDDDTGLTRGQRSKTIEKPEMSLPQVLKLGAFMRSCANFVRILTGKDIPVRYKKGEDSYTDGKSVVLSANIEGNFDSTVGLALHEASHILLTQFSFITELIEGNGHGYSRTTALRDKHIPQELVEKILKLVPQIKNWNWGKLFKNNFPRFVHGEDEATQAAIVYLLINYKDILNWIEDRRIDSYVYGTAPGYRGYYEALYNRYFHSEDTQKMIANTKMHNEETMDSYIARIIGLITPGAPLNILKGLPAIAKKIDLANIDRLKSTSDAADLATDILKIVVDHIEGVNFVETKMQKMAGAQGDADGSDSNAEFDPDGIDIESLSDKECKEMFGVNKATLKRMLNKLKGQKKFGEGNVKKAKLSNTVAKQIADMVEAGISMDIVSTEQEKYRGDGSGSQSVNILFIGRMTPGVLENANFRTMFSKNTTAYGCSENIQAINEGFVLGKLLGSRLQVRNEEKSLKHTRQDSGKIDRRLISALGYDVTSIFSKTDVTRYPKAHIHISVDISGSMSGLRMFKALKTATAIAVASSMVSNIECVVSFRGTTYENIPAVAIGYDSRVNKLSHLRKYFAHIYPNSTTPESLCYPSIMKNSFPKPSSDTNFYFVNLSDGAPFFSTNKGTNGQFSFSGDVAIRHCKALVTQMKRDFNAVVIAYLITGSGWGEADFEDFTRMYGSANAFNIDTSRVDLIARTMNKKFLEGSTKKGGAEGAF